MMMVPLLKYSKYLLINFFFPRIINRRECNEVENNLFSRRFSDHAASVRV